jgi:hypothetical protein
VPNVSKMRMTALFVLISMHSTPKINVYSVQISKDTNIPGRRHPNVQAEVSAQRYAAMVMILEPMNAMMATIGMVMDVHLVVKLKKTMVVMGEINKQKTLAKK